MLKTNLITVIRSLSQLERRELALFITSNSINKRQDVLALYNYISNYVDKSPIKLKKPNVFKQLFPHQEYDEKQIRYLISFLNKALERFLINKELENDEVQGRIYLLQAYRRKRISKSFYKSVKQTEAIVKKISFRNDEFYEKAFQIEYEKYSFSVNTERNAPRNLQELNDMIDLSYLSKKLRISCVSLAHQSVYKVDYDKGLLNSILQNIEQSTFLKYPIIALYYFYLKAFTTTSGLHYYKKFKIHLKEHADLIPNNELRDIYVLAINYCIKQFNLGDEKYLREVFELYQFSLNNDLLLEHGIISHFAFKNIVGIGLRLKEFEWVDSFIQNYQLNLHSKYRSNYVDYNTAKLWYAQKKHKEAMLKLIKVEYDDLFLNLDVKVLLLKIYYELKEFDVLESHINSFQKYVQRKKLIGYHQENYLNIILLTKKLVELNPHDLQEKKKLKSKILATKALGERNWLLNQIEVS